MIHSQWDFGQFGDAAAEGRFTFFKLCEWEAEDPLSGIYLPRDMAKRF
jgi:hypothetical protein